MKRSFTFKQILIAIWVYLTILWLLSIPLRNPIAAMMGFEKMNYNETVLLQGITYLMIGIITSILLLLTHYIKKVRPAKQVFLILYPHNYQ